ncbi:MAG TPA: PEP-CTERM sorting domain-containing protein [Burkholderiales bacterium]|nr:PEP-CTERM sorting domain-containing protein [Burkholderiales bacterium]
MKISSLIRTLAIAALVAGSGIANAALIYNVNLSVGSGSATGTITTDGTFGVLSGANILDWNILLDGNPGGLFTLLGPGSGNNSAVAVVGSNLVGSAADLTFDFGAATGYTLFQNPTTGSSINYLCFAAQLCGNFSHAINLGTNVFGVNTNPQEGVAVVATAATSVPEPATLALIGFAMLGILLVRRRQKV